MDYVDSIQSDIDEKADIIFQESNNNDQPKSSNAVTPMEEFHLTSSASAPALLTNFSDQTSAFNNTLLLILSDISSGQQFEYLS